MAKSDASLYRRFLKEELFSAARYRALAKTEGDPARAHVFERLADNEIQHAVRWASLLGRDSNSLTLPRYSPTLLIFMFIARLFGSRRLVPMLLRGEAEGYHTYLQIDEARDMAHDERSHEAELRRLVAGDQEESEWPHPENAFFTGQSGTLRAAVLGINDGLVSNLSLVMGVAGGSSNHAAVLLAGVAGLLAGSFSMAAGEYISMQSQKDVYEAAILEERMEMERWPDEEKAEMALLYRRKGLTQEEAETIAERIMAQPDVAMETKAREELGLDPDELGSPWGAALSSYLSFTIGAIVPIIPFIFGADIFHLALSWIFSGVALALVGGGLAWVSRVNVFFGATRMLIVGSAAAAATYGIGHGLGAVIG